MKKSLFIFLSFLTTASYSQNDKGVVINGITWATCNVGASNPEEYGDYFTWEEAQTACPKGWRLPTLEEFEMFDELEGNVPSEWTTLNGVNGRNFGSDINTIFLPAAGASDLLSHIGALGDYWSSTEETDYDEELDEDIEVPNEARGLGFKKDKLFFFTANRNDSCSVRCVKE